MTREAKKNEGLLQVKDTFEDKPNVKVWILPKPLLL
jgi:hypothetical protein